MRRARYSAAALPALALAAFAFGCSDPTGELIVVVQSDMAMPKDIDTMKFEVYAAGVRRHESEVTNLGNPTSLLMPATLGILAPEDPATPVTIRVTARKGGQHPAGRVRVLREATTTIPQDSIEMFHIPVNFLCDDSGTDEDGGESKNTFCGDGETCVAGSCVPTDKVDPPVPYEPQEIYGGGVGKHDGTCFDVTGCMEGGALALPTMEGEECKLALDPGAGDVNIAILTEVDGICGDGCFVPLDAESSVGFRRAPDAPGTITVPKAVCEKLGTKVRGLVMSQVRGGCPLKTVRTPTCGPWSAVGDGSGPDVSEPATRASGQHHPLSIALLSIKKDLDVYDEQVFWVSSGLFFRDEQTQLSTQVTPGTLQSASLDEGAVRLIHSIEERSGRDVVMSATHVYWTVANALGTGGKVMRAKLVLDEIDGKPHFDKVLAPEELPVDAKNPEGLAVTTNRVLWTEFTTGDITVLTLVNDAPGTVSTLVQGDPSKRPSRIAADDKRACFTNEGLGKSASGSVECVTFEGNVVETVVSGQPIPRAIALDADGLYWATFDKNGAIYRAPREPMSGAFVKEGDVIKTTTLAMGQAYPNGIALDAKFVYWTNWGDGTVWRVAREGGAPPQKIASGQRKPAEIVIGDKTIFWINEGASVTKSNLMTTPNATSVVGDGALVKLAKPM